jgi:hypothetical protein
MSISICQHCLSEIGETEKYYYFLDAGFGNGIDIRYHDNCFNLLSGGINIKELYFLTVNTGIMDCSCCENLGLVNLSYMKWRNWGEVYIGRFCREHLKQLFRIHVK